MFAQPGVLPCSHTTISSILLTSFRVDTALRTCLLLEISFCSVVLVFVVRACLLIGISLCLVVLFFVCFLSLTSIFCTSQGRLFWQAWREARTSHTSLPHPHLSTLWPIHPSPHPPTNPPFSLTCPPTHSTLTHPHLPTHQPTQPPTHKPIPSSCVCCSFHFAPHLICLMF